MDLTCKICTRNCRIISVADLEITLRPIKGPSGYPRIKVTFNSNRIETISLDETKTYTFKLSDRNNSLKIDYTKNEKDPTQAVEVVDVKIAGYDDHKILQQCRYVPMYPEPWAQQQRDKAIKLEKVLNASTYLGWSGQWYLEMHGSLFTWLHKTLAHGWIYPVDHVSLS